MQRYWRVYKAFFRSAFARELEFRANFFAKIAQNLLWIVFFLLVILVIYRNADSVAGWSRGDAFILGATCFIMNALYHGFAFGLFEIPQHVRQGTLDFVITKPIDTQFWVSVRRVNLDQAGSLIAGVVMIGIGVSSSGLHPNLVQWFAYSAMTLLSTLIFYSFNLALMTLGIWLVRVDNLWVLGETVMSVARYPIDVYSQALQRVFVFFVPLAFIATIPARQLVVGLDPGMISLGVVWACVFVVLSRVFWNRALQSYSSASS